MRLNLLFTSFVNQLNRLRAPGLAALFVGFVWLSWPEVQDLRVKSLHSTVLEDASNGKALELLPPSVSKPALQDAPPAKVAFAPAKSLFETLRSIPNEPLAKALFYQDYAFIPPSKAPVSLWRRTLENTFQLRGTFQGQGTLPSNTCREARYWYYCHTITFKPGHLAWTKLNLPIQVKLKDGEPAVLFEHNSAGFVFMTEQSFLPPNPLPHYQATLTMFVPYGFTGVKLGWSGSYISWIREALALWRKRQKNPKLKVELPAPVLVPSDLDRKLDKQIRAFQRKEGLPSRGYFGLLSYVKLMQALGAFPNLHTASS